MTQIETLKSENLAALHRHNAEIMLIHDSYEEKVATAVENWRLDNLSKIREEAIAASKRVERGQTTEHLVPFIRKDANAKDYHFLGMPIDYICFHGAADPTADLTIEFLEVKTGEARLSTIQRRIRDAIKNKRIIFTLYNPDKESK